MAPSYVWKFSCDQQFTIARYEPNKRDVRKVASSTAVTVVITLPNQCPECVWAVQEAERKEKELLAQNKAALAAHKEHGKFLETQLCKSAADPALNEVFKKLYEDCVFLQAGKVVEILLAQDKDFSEPDFDSLHMIRAAEDNLKILENVAQIQRKAAQLSVPPKETERALSKSMSWVALNHSISLLLNADYEVDTFLPTSDKNIAEAGRCWRTAVKLAKGMERDRRT